MPTFSDVLAGVEMTPGEASAVLYSWAQNFHDSSPDLAGKLRAAADKLNAPAEPEPAETTSTRKRVTAE